MYNGFVKGVIVGSIIGASIGMMMEPGVMRGRNRRKIARAGMSLARKSGQVIGDVVDIFR